MDDARNTVWEASVKSTNEIRQTVEQLEDLLGKLKSALEQDGQISRIPALCQSSISAVPDWP